MKTARRSITSTFKTALSAVVLKTVEKTAFVTNSSKKIRCFVVYATLVCFLHKIIAPHYRTFLIYWIRLDLLPCDFEGFVGEIRCGEFCCRVEEQLAVKRFDLILVIYQRHVNFAGIAVGTAGRPGSSEVPCNL